MVSKKRGVLKRVQAGLDRQTAKLSPDNADAMYTKVRRRMAVTRTLDKFGIVDPRKRQKIQEIIGRMHARFQMLVQTKSVNSLKTAAKRSATDLYLKQCRDELREELDAPISGKFYRRFLASQLYLLFKLRPKKKKLK